MGGKFLTGDIRSREMVVKSTFTFLLKAGQGDPMPRWENVFELS